MRKRASPNCQESKLVITIIYNYFCNNKLILFIPSEQQYSQKWVY